VRIAPEDPGIQFYLGTTLLLHKDGRSAEAVAPLRKALRSNPNWIACLQNLGVALVKSGHTEKAVAYLERARDLDPDSAAIRTGLGHAYLRLQRPSAARAELQIALRHRNDPIIHLGLAMAWAENDADDQARRHLAIALARDPHLAERAAASPALRRLGGEQELLDDRDVRTPTPPLDIELPAARRAGGPTG
jgi:tetratricopeptide (TPR) repeat protein